MIAFTTVHFLSNFLRPKKILLNLGPIREKLSQDMKRVDVDATSNHVDRLHDLIYEQISGKYMLLLILKENERKL